MAENGPYGAHFVACYHNGVTYIYRFLDIFSLLEIKFFLCGRKAGSKTSFGAATFLKVMISVHGRIVVVLTC